jgi:hypothetical protein
VRPQREERIRKTFVCFFVQKGFSQDKKCKALSFIIVKTSENLHSCFLYVGSIGAKAKKQYGLDPKQNMAVNLAG